MVENSEVTIISESCHHLSHSENPFVNFFANTIFNILVKEKVRQFTEEELYQLYRKFYAKKMIDTGRDIIGIFEEP
jgi:hypothetical protein